MNTPLALSVRLSAELRDQLKALYDLEDGDETLEDTLEGASDLNEKLAVLLREAIRCEAMSEGMKAIIKDNTDRRARLDHTAGKLRGIVMSAMGMAGLRKLPAPDFTATLSDGRAPVQITDETTIAEWPIRFVRVTREPNKTEIRKYLEDGERLDFATLGNQKPILTIKTK